MEVILSEINYKGHHFDEVVINLPQIENFDDVPYEKFNEYLCDRLDTLIAENESN